MKVNNVIFYFSENKIKANTLVGGAVRKLKAILAIMFCCFIILSSTPAPSAQTERDSAKLWLECKDFEGGMVEVSLMLESAEGICGLYAVLEYDESALLLVSCGVAEQNADVLNFTFRDDCGRTVFLVDGKQNSAPSGALASFYFKLSGEKNDGGQIRLLPVADRCAFCLDGGGELREIGPYVSGATVKVDQQGSVDIVTDASAVRLCSVSTQLGDRELILNIVGNVQGKNCFAVAFKVFAVDVNTARTSTTVVARVTNKEKVELSASIPFDERVCVIITPLSYNGREIAEGDKQVFVFE